MGSWHSKLKVQNKFGTTAKNPLHSPPAYTFMYDQLVRSDIPGYGMLCNKINSLPLSSPLRRCETPEVEGETVFVVMNQNQFCIVNSTLNLY